MYLLSTINVTLFYYLRSCVLPWLIWFIIMYVLYWWMYIYTPLSSSGTHFTYQHTLSYVAGLLGYVMIYPHCVILRSVLNAITVSLRLVIQYYVNGIILNWNRIQSKHSRGEYLLNYHSEISIGTR